jgi:hypothetical protein
MIAAAIGIDVDVGHLDELLPELDQPRVERFIELADGDITIRRPLALPNKFSALFRQNPHFSLSWERRRPDLRDQTLSGYEMSLASIAANARWTAQEICDLLVAFREKERGRWHGRSYFRTTLGKALGQAAKHRRDQREGAFQQADEAASEAKEEGHSSAETDDKAKLLAKLNRACILQGRNLRFTDVKRRGSCYVAFDDLGHEIQLGTVREMNAFVVTQANIAEATGINLSIPGTKKATWFPVVEVFIAIAHSQPIEFDYGLREETRIYLARALDALTSHNPDYAQRVGIRNSEELFLLNLSLRTGLRDSFLHYDLEGRAPKCWPRFVVWTKDGELCVQVPMLQTFLSTPVGGNERISTDRLKQGLAMMQFAIDKVKTGQFQGQKISYRWCISPTAFALDPGCDPQPGLNPEQDADPEQPP